MGETRGKDADAESAASGGRGSVDVILPDGFGASFGERAIRARFVRKVYAILMTQLCVTFGIVAFLCLSPAVKGFYCYTTVMDDQSGLLKCRGVSNAGLALYLVSYGVFFVTMITLVCCGSIRRRFPANVIAMSIFTLALSLLTGCIALQHDVWWVLMAVGITAALCLGLTLFSFQTKIDFTGIGMYLFGATWILFIFGIVAVVFFFKGLPVLYTVYSGLFALLFSIFLIYDTQQIIGGKKYALSPEEHIYAALTLYIDVVYIFLGILGMGGRN